jgi:O-antigen ligase
MEPLKNQRVVLLATSSLLVAGFLVMLGLGFLGARAFAWGLALFAAGVAVSAFLTEARALRQMASILAVLFLVNLTVYSSVKVLPFVDVSLAIYGILASALLVVAVNLRRLNEFDSWRLPRWPLALVFLFSLGLSAISAEAKKEALYFLGLNAGAIVMAYIFINIFRQNYARLVALVKTLVVLALASSGFAVWQLYSQSFKFFYYPYLQVRDQKIMELWEVVSRVVGTWQHPSYLGIFIAISIPLNAYLIFYATRRQWEKLFWAAVLIFNSATLLLTNTRSSVIAGAVGVAAMYILANVRAWEFLRRLPNVKKIAILGLAAAAALLIYQFVFVAEIYTKPQAWRVDASATVWGRFLRSDSMSSESLVQRSQLYTLAWQTFLRHPVLGIGGKNFQYEAERAFGQGTDAHNLILQTLAETGIIGLAATAAFYLAIVISLFLQLMKVGDLKRKYLQSALLAATFLIFFDSFFNNPLYSLRITAIFWVIIALQYCNYYAFETEWPKSA